MPAFFMPPKDFLELPYVDGTFAWNNAWWVSHATSHGMRLRPLGQKVITL